MRQQSPRRAAQQRERRKIAQRHHGPVRCHWPGGCANEAVDHDEILTRGRGGSATDIDNIVPLCRTHHDWKHDHPVEAQALGLMPSQHGRTRSDDTPTSCNAFVAQSYTLPGMAERRPISMRVGEQADAWVNDKATGHGVSRAVVLRAMLSVATAHPREVDAKIAAIKDTA